MRTPRPPVVTLVAFLTACLLVGCGGQHGDGGSTGTGGAPASGEGSSSGAAPGRTAATGPEISTDSVTLNVPEGWEVREVSNAITSATSPQGPLITVSVKDFPINTEGEPDPLDQLARAEVRAEVERVDPEILPETEVAGVPAFHIAGPISDSLYLESFGPAIADRSVVIGYEGLSVVRAKRRQEIIDSVLATVEWTY